MPVMWLIVIAASIWMAKPWVVETFADTFDFITTAEADEQTKEIKEELAVQGKAITVLADRMDVFSNEYRMDNAVVTLRNAKRDLELHKAEALNTRSWAQQLRNLDEKVTLAEEYKSCLQGNQPNCHLIQRQLWR